MAIVMAAGLLLAGTAHARTDAPAPEKVKAATRLRSRVLRLGDHGRDVRRLRRDLVRLGYMPPRAFGPVYDDRVALAVTALQKWEGLPRDGVLRLRERRAVRRLRGPVPELHLNRLVRAEVLLDRQLLLVIHRDHVIRTFPISSGVGGLTPPGSFSVYSKSPSSWSKRFKVWLPWASYFNDGIAFHAYPDVPVYPASHGCVRVPVKFAHEVYTLLPAGARVDVIAMSM